MQRQPTDTFDPKAMAAMRGAFDDAWQAVRDRTTEGNREDVRDAVGRAVIDLAKAGHSHNRTTLTNYAVYRGQLFIDMHY